MPLLICTLLVGEVRGQGPHWVRWVGSHRVYYRVIADKTKESRADAINKERLEEGSFTKVDQIRPGVEGR